MRDIKRPGDFRVVNRSVPREDGVAKVTGQARFTSDIILDGMAYAKVLRSPFAHARILSIHAQHVSRQPGVIAVLTGDDVKGTLNPYYGHAVKDHPLIAIEKVRFVGEPVVAVIAEDELSALEALEEIVVEYEELPAVLTVEEALAEGAPLVHERLYREGSFRGFEDPRPEGLTNICQAVRVEWGDVDEGFARARYIVEGEYSFPMAYAYAMEPYVAIADVREGGVTVYTSAQHPFMVRHDLAEIFRLPLHQVRVIVPYVGGGYGSKSYTKIEPLVAACSWKAGRPVKLQLSVEEAIVTTRGHDARIWIRTGVDAEGRLLAREARIYLNTGAYAENGPLVCKKAAHRVIGPYRIPNVRVESYAIYTNTAPASSFRGFGAPQVTFAAESQIDELAEQLGWDPVDFRLANLARRGEEIHPGLRPLDADLVEDVRTAARALGWGTPLPPGHGRAVACSASDAGAEPVTSVVVRLASDQSCTIFTGSTEIGQGSRTVLAQIVAEELGVELEKIRIVASDTALTPFDRSTGASRTTTLMGRAVWEACQDILAQLREMAAEVLNVEPAALTEEPGGIRWEGRRISWGEIIERYFRLPGSEVVGRAYLRRAGELARLPVFWEIGCAGVEIAVDEETGVIRMERLVTVGDVGLAIHPAMAEGQDLGAATMGYGLGLFETLVYEGQQLVTTNLLEYRVPRFSDLPKEIQTILVQNQDGVGPYGAKGGGEGALNPIPASLANALARATGVRIRELPLTPEREGCRHTR